MWAAGLMGKALTMTWVSMTTLMMDGSGGERR
jgi:hypothetical protein